MSDAVGGLERLRGSFGVDANTDVTKECERIEGAIGSIREPLVDRWVKLNAVDILTV